MSEDPEWLQKAREVYKFHRAKLLSNDKWTVEQTAKELRMSYGGASQYLLIGRWLRTHENQLVKMTSIHNALSFIRSKQKEQRLAEL